MLLKAGEVSSGDVWTCVVWPVRLRKSGGDMHGPEDAVFNLLFVRCSFGKCVKLRVDAGDRQCSLTVTIRGLDGSGNYTIMRLLACKFLRITALRIIWQAVHRQQRGPALSTKLLFWTTAKYNTKTVKKTEISNKHKYRVNTAINNSCSSTLAQTHTSFVIGSTKSCHESCLMLSAVAYLNF